MKKIANLCNLERYSSCLNISKTTNTDCLSQCTDLCERIVMNMITRKTLDYDGQFRHAQLTISMKSLQFPMYEEKLKWSQETFLGAFGGIIGFFLCLDFFKISMSSYIFLGRIYKNYQQKKSSKIKNQNTN